MKMEICDCMLTLGGEVKSIIVQKDNITVAEAAVLNEMHGGDAISLPINIRTVDVNTMNLKAYLSQTYVRRAGDEKARNIADNLFPGMSPNFPATFAEIGIYPAVSNAQGPQPIKNDFSIFEPDGENSADAVFVDADSEDAENAAELNADVDGAIYDAAGNIVAPSPVVPVVAPAKTAEGATAPVVLAEGPKPLTAAEKKLAALVGA